MNDLSFDALSRFAAGAIPPRAQDRENVTAGSVPPTHSVTGEAKKHKNKSSKKARQECRKQVARCTTSLATLCQSDPTCLGFAQRCCPLLGTCDAGAFIDCIVL